jgi:hypothetical protein
MGRQLRAEIEVEASPERVWEILTDFAAYRHWNPFIVEGAGQAVPGGRLELRMRLPGRRPMTFRPTILEAEPPAASAGSGGCWRPACSTASTASPSSPPGRAGSAWSSRRSSAAWPPAPSWP